MKIRPGMSPFDQLKAMYTLFENQVPQLSSTPLVCREKCASCCTCNVTLTSLEARFLIDRLSKDSRKQMINKIRPELDRKRYLPKMTFNQFAGLCKAGKEAPEEENNPDWGQCALLDNQLCSIYEYRPFGCRALLSTSDCSKTGYARLPESILTLNNLLMQYIEHLDKDGFSGNLLDMLAHFLPDPPQTVETGMPVFAKDGIKRPFVENQPIPILMVPPGFRADMRPIIQSLNEILSAGKAACNQSESGS